MTGRSAGVDGADIQLAQLIAGSRAAVVERVRALAEATRAIADSDNPPDDLRQEAHRLAGTAGMVGLAAASDAARQLETALNGHPAALTEQAYRLADALLDAVAEPAGTPLAELLTHAAPTDDTRSDQPRSDQGRTGDAHADGPRVGHSTTGQTHDAPAVPRADSRPLVVVALADQARADEIVAALHQRGLRATARRDASSMVADIVLVGLDDAEGTDAALATIPDDAVKAPVVVALARGMDTGLRVRAVHAGVTDILDPALSAEAVADALRARVEALTDERATVLAVDDDPVVVEAIAAVLGGDDVDVVGLEDPQRFWEVLTEVRPELLVLDVDMPGFSGVDLCRAARLDPRSRALPIIFLSAHNSPEMVHEVFTAGGDDFVTKPFVGPELRTRILSRIERVRLHRRLADTDPLTGLANRRRLDEDLSRLISLTSRRGEQFVLAVLDVDLFKAVNDEYGHDVGDRALQQLGHHLRRRFRAEDLVGRIGGEEFIVALASSDVDGAVRRLAWVLGDFRRRGVPGHESDMLHIGVSAGAAVFPRDGADFHTLYRTADTALRTAKTTGRGRVLLVGGDGVHLT